MWGPGILVFPITRILFSVYVSVSVCCVLQEMMHQMSTSSLESINSGGQIKEKSFPYAFRQKNFLKQQ